MSMLRMPAVKAATGHKSHASIYNAIHEDLFTKPVPLGLRARGWPQSEVEAIVAARTAGCSDEQIRALVTKLHAARRDRWAALEQTL